jgi:hypothetical protein
LGIIAIGLLAVALGLAAIFVMRDMTRRGQRAWPWGVLIVAAPLVGLLIWAVLRNNWPAPQES